MLIINEWRFAFRQPILWLSFILTLCFTAVLSIGLADVDVNASKQLQLKLIALQMLVLPIVIAVLSTMLFLRDHQTNMRELIEVTPVKDSKRYLVRFIALFILVTGIMTSSAALMFIVHIKQLGFQFASFNTLWLNILITFLPNTFFLAVVAFWVSKKSNSSLPCYFLFGLIWMAYLLLAGLSGNPVLAGSKVIDPSFFSVFKVFDPYGFTALLSQLSQDNWFWNELMVTNRLFFLLIGIIALFFTLKKNGQTESNRKSKPSKEVQTARHLNNSGELYRTAKIKSSALNIFLSLYYKNIRTIFFNRVTFAVFALWPLFIIKEVISSNGYVEPMSQMDYTSLDVLNHFVFGSLQVFGTFMIVLWSWQICTLERRWKTSEIVTAAPVKNIQFVFSQIASLFTALIFLYCLTFIGASFGQWVCQSNYQPSVYIPALILSGLPTLLVGCFCIAVFHWYRSPLIAVLTIVFILLTKYTPVLSLLGIDHPLLKMLWTPIQEPDLFWGYRSSIESYWPFLRVWFVAILTCVIAATISSHRGAGLSRRKLQFKHAYLLLPVTFSIVVFYQLHTALVTEKPLMNAQKREAFKVQYEEKYAHWQSKPQPSIIHIDSQVDFYPSQKKASFSLVYTLKNQTDLPIKQVLIGRSAHFPHIDGELDDAKQIVFDKTLNQKIFEFEKALQPGDTKSFKTEFTFYQPTHWPVTGHQFVTPELSYIRGVPLIPTIGYQQNYELQDDQLRKKYQLTVNVTPPPSELFADENFREGQYQWITTSSRVTTESGYHVVTQGELISQKSVDGRNIYDFNNPTPMRAIPAWLTMPYDSINTTQNGVNLHVFTPRKNEAAQINLKAMADTVEWLSTHISTYRGQQISLINVPEMGFTGYALPQIVLIGDNVGFRSYPNSETVFDQRYRRAVHETAHQWFGHDIGNGVENDHAFLVESMAKYIELVLLEKHYGKPAVESLISYENMRYQQRERADISHKVPLVDATKSYDQYSHATLAFAELREQVGDQVIIKALQKLWQNHSYPQPPANSMDFIRYLKLATDSKYHQLINRLFLIPRKIQ